ncbi:MAG: CDP-glycerol glycerophosphotransferase family protein [Dehalococcoidales bacterium]|nr:CDP-glycerol glycerophosphotransferase family protein [Dehalococcoidales bacterium]
MKSRKIDFYARQRHFIDHLVPIYQQLPEINRGQFVVTNDELLVYAASIGIQAVKVTSYLDTSTPSKLQGPLVVASMAFPIKMLTPQRKLVLLNHGAGQSFADNRHVSYAGGKGRGLACLFIEPGQHPAAKDAAAYPGSKIAIVGCPKLDSWHLKPREKRSNPPVVVISFHWECKVVPETRSTLPYYRRVIPQLGRWNKTGEVEILGHGHPAIWTTLKPLWERYGIEPVANFEEVMERSDVYVCDQMSTLYEFASLDRPVVVLNAPWYRRDIEHGLRFWDCADVGVNCDHPEDLIPFIKRALKDTREQRKKRHIAVKKVYEYTDGCAAERAAQAIMEVL